jgi:hypothetical protein
MPGAALEAGRVEGRVLSTVKALLEAVSSTLMCPPIPRVNPRWDLALARNPR